MGLAHVSSGTTSEAPSSKAPAKSSMLELRPAHEGGSVCPSEAEVEETCRHVFVKQPGFLEENFASAAAALQVKAPRGLVSNAEQ